MNNWTVVGPRRKPTKTQHPKEKSKTKYNRTNQSERFLLQSMNSTYSNTGKKNPRHGQGNRKEEVGVRSFDRSQTKIRHANKKLAITQEIMQELSKSPEKLRNLQYALRYEDFLRNKCVHARGNSKGQQQAREQVKFEKYIVNNAIRQLYLNSRPSNCPTAPKPVKQKLVERSLCTSKRLFH